MLKKLHSRLPYSLTYKIRLARIAMQSGKADVSRYIDSRKKRLVSKILSLFNRVAKFVLAKWNKLKVFAQRAKQSIKGRRSRGEERGKC